jgi:hypothetical protein
MTQEVFWQVVLLAGSGFVGSLIGSRINIAKLEVRVDNHEKTLQEVKGVLAEHEGTINSHSVQLAVLDKSGGRHAL